MKAVNRSLHAQFTDELNELRILAKEILRAREAWWGSRHNGTEYHFSTVNTGNFLTIYLPPDLRDVAIEWMVFYGNLATKRVPNFGPYIDVMTATLDIVESWRWGDYPRRLRECQRSNYWNWGSNKWDGFPAVSDHELCDAGTINHGDGE